MTTQATAPEELYDPDNPPEDRGFIGKLTITAYVDGETVTPSYDGANERIIASCQKYADSAKQYAGPLWYLEAEGISVVREDGEPFRVHDTLKLKTAKGANLGAKQAPDLVAQSFRAHAVTASYTKVGTAESAVGRTFAFSTHDHKLGGGFTKAVRLFPKEIMPEGFVFDGEVRTVATRVADEGAPAQPGASTLTETEVIAILQEIFHGVRPTDLMQKVLDDPRLQTVVNVLGVPLLGSATDESIVGVLVEHKVMSLSADGRLTNVVT